VKIRGWILAFLLALLPGWANGQVVLTIQELELEYSSKVQTHRAALDVWEVLESRYDRAVAETEAAEAAGDAARKNRAFTLFLQLSGEIRDQERRVGELAQEVREARSALLVALGQRVDDLLRQLEEATDPQEEEELNIFLRDNGNRLVELRAEEEPETSLEPMQDVTIDPRDSPADILRKANNLEFRANRYEAQLAGVSQRLEELREDQRRSRRVSDFNADLNRYDDTRLPVVSPANRTTPPPDAAQRPTDVDSLGTNARPMTLEERIESLELLEEELGFRIQQARDKAARFRQRAGGVTDEFAVRWPSGRSRGRGFRSGSPL
jgi:hypothetical protein